MGVCVKHSRSEYVFVCFMDVFYDKTAKTK